MKFFRIKGNAGSYRIKNEISKGETGVQNFVIELKEKKIAMVCPCEKMDRTLIPKRALQLQFKGKGPNTRLSDAEQRRSRNVERAVKEVKREDCKMKEESGRLFHPSTHVKYKKHQKRRDT